MLQVIQNKVARCVTKCDWNTLTNIVLKQCNWLNVPQMVAYHSLLSLHKTLVYKQPVFMYNNKITGAFHEIQDQLKEET